MSRYGEPWTNDSQYVLDSEGNFVAEPIGVSTDPGNRIVTCVNACAEMEFEGDPQGAVRELVQAITEIRKWLLLPDDEMFFEDYDAAKQDTARLDAALARFQIEEPQ